jgi:AcrR family transcriptional regulator
MGKREETHKALTEKLLDVATIRINQSGLENLRARDVTNDAGCALGTLYKCYEDLDDLIIHVNSTTLKKMREALNEAVVDVSEPSKALKELAFAYLDFAVDHQNLWAAVFKHRLRDGDTTPDWHVLENKALLDLIAKPMSEINPDLDNEQLQARTRTYFAAVHGIVSISLQDRFISLSGKVLRAELEHFVGRLSS